MTHSARLERLNKLLQPDLAALPDRTVEKQTLPEHTSDTDGVLNRTSNPPSANTSEQLVVDTTTVAAQENLEQRFVLVSDAASSYTPTAVEAAVTLAPHSTLSPSLPATDLVRGDLASARHHFTPIVALAKYPYKYCDRNLTQPIASAFFDAGKFWKREWDLYYVWDLEELDRTKPVILVRESQFQSLLDEINNHLKLGLCITDIQREEGLVGKFPSHPDCLPRYLGRSRSREQYNEMVNAVPHPKYRRPWERHPSPPDPRSLEQFKQTMEEMWEAQKAKSKEIKAKKVQDRLARQQVMADSFKRTQRYLGLRATASLSSGNTRAAGPLDPSLVAPYTFDRDVVFVCVDVESYEMAHHKITEVGIASLDTRDLIGVAPGKDGEDWRKYIKARHFRIKENHHLINSVHVQGCPDRFEFGESTFVTLHAAAANIAACFCPPFGLHASNTKEDEMERILSSMNHNEPRNMILLGHDTANDVRYLQQLNYNPMEKDKILETLDTAVMYRVWRREHNATNLGRILHSFDIVGWYLHNAGNDAVYTIQAMLAICVREATVRGTPQLQAMRNQDKADRLEAAHQEAKQRAKENEDGWSDMEARGDGGNAVRTR